MVIFIYSQNLYNMKRNINTIISEEIDNQLLITEDKFFDKLMNFVKKIDSNRKKKKNKKKDDEKHEMRKKKVVGGTENYDYTDYQSKNKKLSKSDYEKIVNSIDQENTDIAAVARKVFPGHTEEGAQSQLRKILNGERPMTRPVAKKLKVMISRGQIAVK